MNKILLIGRITSTPIVYETKNLKKYVRTTIAVNREFQKDITDFIPLTIFGNSTEYFIKYVNKGDLMSIDGSVQVSNYKNDKGEMVNSFTVIPAIARHLEPKSIVSARSETNFGSSANSPKYEDKQRTNSIEPSFSEDEKDDNDVWELDL